jgi:CRP-like cAMP-binding protein
VPAGTALMKAGRTVSHVYFPTTGVVSVLVGTSTGESADALTVGNEGMVGLAVWLGIRRSLDTVVQQIPGEMIRFGAQEFCDRLEANRKVRKLLNHYAGYSLRYSHQNAVCNAHHSVEQRACRWLVNTADRARSTLIVVTQATLAEMLGVRRQSIGELAVALQREGLIVYRRNEITILDRRALEGRACECYRSTVQLYREVVEPLL